MSRPLRCLLPALVLILVLSGCSGGENAPPDRPEPCSDAWDEHVETVLTTGDGMGHGPDIGSDEWKSVIEFKLGVRGEAAVPDRTTQAWCDYIDQLLPREEDLQP